MLRWWPLWGPVAVARTTLLNCLSGLDEIDSGQVLIDGVVLHQFPDDERSDYRARRMGFVFQLYNLLPVLSAVENVRCPSSSRVLVRERLAGGRWRYWTWWDSRTGHTTFRESFQEGSGSG